MNRSDRSSTESPGLGKRRYRRYAVRMPFPAAAYCRTTFTGNYPGAKPWFGRPLTYPAVEGWVDPQGEPTGHLEQRALYETRLEAAHAAVAWIDPQIVEVWLC